MHRNLDPIDWGIRAVASKAGKEINRKNALIAALKEKNNYIKTKA